MSNFNVTGALDCSALGGTLKELLIDYIYPVGSYFITESSSFNTVEKVQAHFGGTWAKVTGAFLFGSDNAGITGGEATHTLTIDEIPRHTHSYRVGWGSGGYDELFRGGAPAASGVTNEGVIVPTGGGKEHNNMPPYRTVYMYRRTH